MLTRFRLIPAALLVVMVCVALTVPSAVSTAARCRTAAVPTPVTSGQTNPAQMQVRWAAGANVAKYRLHWSPAPYGNWPGYNPYTGWYGKTARLAAVTLPAVGSGDKFLNVNYGNPKFAQLQVNNGCDSTVRSSPYVAVWPRGKTPANATNGDPLAVGTYNVELFPTTEKNPVKMTNLANNIASKNLDLVLLQEATYKTATDMAAKLGSGWKVSRAGLGSTVNQQILFRGSRFREADDDYGTFGQRDDNNASTPLPTPWARLQPVGGAPQKGIFVVAVHLEESSSTSVLTKKAAVNNAAVALLKSIAGKNTGPALPVVLGGDLKGNFQRYCDEKSSPACRPDGQATFIRAGYYDAQAALTRVGVGYGTVNKHVFAQPYNKSGYGGRADYLVFKGFPGVSRYENVKKGYGNGSAFYQSDHNLVVANLFVPR